VKKQEKNAKKLLDELLKRYPLLTSSKEDINRAYDTLKKCYQLGGKLLIAGNGGSSADSEHIVGELMKSFLFHRKINLSVEKALADHFGCEGIRLAKNLEGALSAIPLTSMPALTSAFANDVDASVSFAQMLYGYGRKDDVFLGISTSGNSKNIFYALMVARAKEIHSILLTGKTGGRCRDLADIVICVPENETFKIQELHLPIYHVLCAMLEADFFEEV